MSPIKALASFLGGRQTPQRELAFAPVACAAEVAECTCPDFCERDHGND